MPARVIVAGILLVIMAIMLVFFVEFFVPLSIKSDMNMICRNTLLKMEVEGGLSGQNKNELQAELGKKGMNNISITGSENAKQGGMINLHVEAEYSFNFMESLFSRTARVQLMIYDKTSMSRKVVN